MVSICDRVRYVETDMMGVVHHSNYFRWFEMGRVAWLRAAGVELWELMNANIIFPITHVEANYKESALYDDEIEICAEMTLSAAPKWILLTTSSAKKTAHSWQKAARATCLPIITGILSALAAIFMTELMLFTKKSRQRRNTDGSKI